jgi:hypothetical protein
VAVPAPAGRDAAIVAALRARGRARTIDCRDALALAARLGVAPARVGRACDREGIKIVRCRLGCFGTRRKRV